MRVHTRGVVRGPWRRGIYFPLLVHGPGRALPPVAGGVICIREEASHHPWFGAGAVLVGRGARGRCVGFSPTLGLNQPGKIVGCGEGTSGENRAKE